MIQILRKTFIPGDKVVRVKGSEQVGTVRFIYTERVFHVDREGNERTYAHPGEVAVHFNNGLSEDATVPFNPSALKLKS